MDSKPAAPLSVTPLLLAICVALAAIGSAWQAWDMFGPERRPMLQGWDDSFYYFWLPSVVMDRDLDFTNQLNQSKTLDDTARDDALTMERTDTGFIANKYPPGWAIGSLPFFLIAHAFAPSGATGFEPIYLLSVWFGQLLYAALGLWFAVKIVRLFFSAHIATVAVLATWLASPLVYYQSARLAMSHSQVFALAMAVFWIALQIDRGDQRLRQWALLGFLSAMLVVTRNVALIYLTLPAFLFLRRLRTAKAAGSFVLGALGPAAVQLIAWKILYGSWFAYSYGGERFDFANLHLVEILFSPRHGWFYWHPLLLPAIAVFLAWSWRHLEGRAWTLSLVVMVLLNAAWPTWWLGSSFGHRGFEVPTLFAMIGLAALLHAGESRRWLRFGAAGVVTVTIAWNIALYALFLTRQISRQEAVTHGDVLRALAALIG